MLPLPEQNAGKPQSSWARNKEQNGCWESAKPPLRPILPLTVTAVHNLEVFDGGVGDTAVEVEDIGLGLVIPHRRLVVQLDNVVHVLVLPPREQPVIVLGRAKRVRLGTQGDAVPGCSGTHSSDAGHGWEETNTTPPPPTKVP